MELSTGVIAQGEWCSRSFFELELAQTTKGSCECAISIAQPTKRGKAAQRYFYSDISLLVLRVASDGARVEVAAVEALPPRAKVLNSLKRRTNRRVSLSENHETKTRPAHARARHTHLEISQQTIST